MVYETRGEQAVQHQNIETRRGDTHAIAAQPALSDVVLVVWNGNSVTDAQHVQQVQIAIVLSTL